MPEKYEKKLLESAKKIIGLRISTNNSSQKMSGKNLSGQPIKKFCTRKLALKNLSRQIGKVGIGEKILVGKLCGKGLTGKLAEARPALVTGLIGDILGNSAVKTHGSKIFPFCE